MRFMRSQTSFGILISDEKLILRVIFFSSNISKTRATIVFRRRGIRVGENIGSHDPPSWRYDLVTRHPRPLTSPACIPTIPLSSLSVRCMKARSTVVSPRCTWINTWPNIRSHNMFSESLSIKTNTFSLREDFLPSRRRERAIRWSNPIE